VKTLHGVFVSFMLYSLQGGILHNIGLCLNELSDH
jgi:hypothetical protein